MFEDDKSTLKEDVTLSDKEDKSVKSFSVQWLEARGKLDSSKLNLGETHFIEKHKSQATYLTELGGALSVELDGAWNYFMSTESLSLDASGLVIDRVSIKSSDGLVHELEFEIQVKDALASVSSVRYENPYESESTAFSLEEEGPIETSGIDEAEEPVIQEEMSTEDEESLEKDVVLDTNRSDAVEEEVLHSGEVLAEENTLKDAEDHTDKLLKVQELMRQRQEEAALSRQQEEKKKTLEYEKALKDEQEHMEKLLKVQELMNQRREETALIREEEKKTLEESVNEEVSQDAKTAEDETVLEEDQVETEELLGSQTLIQKRQEESVFMDEEETLEEPEVEAENTFEEETEDVELLGSQALMQKIEEATLRTEEDTTEVPEEEVETVELLGSQALMQKKQEESIQMTKEDIVEESEEGLEPAQAHTDDDEMLLKVQALMNAKKTIDTSEIEFTGGDAPSKKEEVKEQEEEENIAEEPQTMQVQEVAEVDSYEESSLKGKIVLDEADGSEVFTSSFYLEGFVLNADGSLIYEPHNITHAYLSEGETESYDFEVEVKGTGSLRLKGRIELIVTGLDEGVDLDFKQGLFSKVEEVQENEYTEMSVDELSATKDDFIEHHDEGAVEETPEDTHGHLAVVFDSLEEGASLHSDGTLGITVLLPIGAQNGETIIINSSEFIITEAEAEAGKLLYSVYPDDEIEVSFRDSDNNISDSIRAKANQRSLEILEFLVSPKLTGEIGAQSMHAGIGAPSNPQVTWGILNKNMQVNNYAESEFGSLHIDGETGELEYKYHEHSGLDKYGSSADNKLNENFIIFLGNEQYADLEVSLHIKAQSIHGYSGHEIDSSTIEEMKLLKIDKSKADVKTEDNTEMIQMLESGLESNKAKISKLMLEIYEAKSTGADVSEAKERLHSLTDKKTHLENKLNYLKQ